MALHALFLRPRLAAQTSASCFASQRREAGDRRRWKAQNHDGPVLDNQVSRIHCYGLLCKATQHGGSTWLRIY